jgi:ankyrin repeat protein
LWDPDAFWKEPDLQKNSERILDTPYYAALLGLRDEVRLVLNKGADTKAPDRIGRTSLLRAAEDGNVAVVSLLMMENPVLAQKSKDFQPFLLHVVANELATVVETICTKDKDQLNSNTLEHGYK